MKWLFILALIANIAFFIYNSLFHEQPSVVVQEKVNFADQQIILLNERILTQIKTDKTTNKIESSIDKETSPASDTLIFEESLADRESSASKTSLTDKGSSFDKESSSHKESLPESMDENIAEPDVEPPAMISKMESNVIDTSSPLPTDEKNSDIALSSSKQSDDKEDIVAIEEPDTVEDTIENETPNTEETIETLADEDADTAKQAIENSEDDGINETQTLPELENTIVDEQITADTTISEKTITAATEEQVIDSSKPEATITENQPLEDTSASSETKSIETPVSMQKQDAESKNIISSRVDTEIETCFEIGPMDKKELDKLKVELENDYPNRLAFVIDATSEVNYYRIYIPPLNSYEATQAALKILDENGLTDHYVMSISGRKNAIAIGVFKKRHAAETVARKAESIGFLPTIEAISKDKNSQFHLFLDFSDAGDVSEFKQKMTNNALEYKVCGD